MKRIALMMLAVICLAGCFKLEVKAPENIDIRGFISDDDGPPKPPKAKKIEASKWYNTKKKIEIKRFRGHSLVLIHFFELGRDQSRAEVQRLVGLRKKWPERDIKIVGVHRYFKNLELGSNLAGLGVEYPVAIDKKDDTFDDYKLTGRPFTVLVGKDGRIFYEGDLSGAVTAMENKLDED